MSDPKYRKGARTPRTCTAFERRYKKIHIFISSNTFGIKLQV